MSDRAAEDSYWWFSDRGALPLDCYRIVVGCVVSGYFVSLLRDAPVLFGQDGIASIRGGAGYLSDLGAVGFHTVLAAMLLLGAAVIVGAAPRFCAGSLFVLQTQISRELKLVSTPSDGIIAFALLWLALLPIGTTLSPIRLAERAPTTRVRSYVTPIFLITVLACHSVSGFWEQQALPAGIRPAVILACWLAPACLVFRSLALCRLAIVILSVIHAYVFWQTGDIGHVVFLATAILFWGSRRESPSRGRPAIDAASAIAAAILFVCAAYASSTAFGLGTLKESSTRILRSAGMIPSTARETPLFETRYLAIAREGSESNLARLDGLTIGRAREQAVFSYLDDGGDPAIRKVVARWVAAVVCRRSSEKHTSGRLWLVSPHGRRALVWIDCEVSPASVVPLALGTGSPATPSMFEVQEDKHELRGEYQIQSGVQNGQSTSLQYSVHVSV